MSTVSMTQPSTLDNALRLGDILILQGEGLNRIAEIVLAVFAVLEGAFASIATHLKPYSDGFKSLAAWTNPIYLYKRIRDWTIQEKGKYIWDRQTWQATASLASLTACNVLSLPGSLKTLGFINPTSWLCRIEPTISLLSHIFLVSTSVFDLWDQAIELPKHKKIAEEAPTMKAIWRHIQEKTPTEQDQVGLTAETKAELNTNLEAYKKVGNQDRKAFAERQIEKWDAKEYNAKVAQSRSWTSVAMDIASIAFVAFAMILPLVTTNAVLLLAAPMAWGAFAILDMKLYLLHKFWEDKEVKETAAAVAA